MTRAEERALGKYPENIRWVGNQWNGAPFDINSESRVAYKQGYQQAEKDLALTWEDLKLLWQIRWEMPVTWEGTEEEWYKELLKRFNEKKKLKA